VIFGGQFEPDRNDRGPSAPTDEHGLDPEAQSAMQSPETFLQAFTDVEPSEIQSLGAERAAITRPAGGGERRRAPAVGKTRHKSQSPHLK
jgi:hypothetical protein